MLDKNSKIFVAGHHGLVGSAIWNNLKQRGYNNLVGRSHKELDLLDPVAVKAFFDTERPDAVVLAAAHVGGIMANLQYRADFIYQNLQIQQNVIGEAWKHGVQKLLFLLVLHVSILAGLHNRCQRTVCSHLLLNIPTNHMLLLRLPV